MDEGVFSHNAQALSAKEVQQYIEKYHKQNNFRIFRGLRVHFFNPLFKRNLELRSPVGRVYIKTKSSVFSNFQKHTTFSDLVTSTVSSQNLPIKLFFLYPG